MTVRRDAGRGAARVRRRPAGEELVKYEWQESDAGPPRKYYRLTEAGKAQLSALEAYWHRINNTISDIGH